MATITKRGNSYRFTVSCGYDLNGKQLRRTMTWTPPEGMTAKQIQKEANRQAVLFEEKCRTGQVLDGSIRFADFAEQWFANYAEKQLRPRTVGRYRELMPRINAAIGHIRLDRLQPHHLMQFYANLEEAGIREDSKQRFKGDLKEMLRSRSITKTAFAEQAGVSPAVLASITQGKNISAESARRVSDALGEPVGALFEPTGNDKGLSAKTILHHHRLISSILSTAVKWQVIFSNPCERVDPPKVENKEAVYLDEEQTAQLLEALEGESLQHQVIVKLLLYTGMRRGELCGLEWGDIDFDSSTIRVQRSSLYMSGVGVFTDETKNESSQRVMKVSDEAIEMLRVFRTAQRKDRLRLGDQWQDSGRIFTTWNGTPIRPDTITGWFHKFIAKSGLPPIHVHSLRHTNASLLIAAGTNLQTVAKRLGHANTTTTSKIYSHAIKSADEAAAETLQDILHPVKRQA
ncbi:tyrosine-type recombinase/integrase [Agathobaculum sp.]|uniref:tyrosine-type recombinase/integrase n=1 Tax=Agathobaculum sp. TaxID=2048138 RepID=UPI0027BAC75F|nr:tyrosine-type recombinase/integrase [Agathobaculum sp.]